MDLWHPDATRVVPSRVNPGRFNRGARWKQVLHTTESMSYSPSRESYFGHQGWPHATIGLQHGIVQHWPINVAARTLKNPPGGVDTNAERAIQCEIVWFARDARRMPRELLDLVRDWVHWVRRETGHPLLYPRFYGQNAGFTLATPTARQRFSAREWIEFSGVCGHQHVPENDHWDPADLDIDYVMRPHEEDDMFTEQDRALLKRMHDELCLRGNGVNQNAWDLLRSMNHQLTVAEGGGTVRDFVIAASKNTVTASANLDPTAVAEAIVTLLPRVDAEAIVQELARRLDAAGQ